MAHFAQMVPYLRSLTFGGLCGSGIVVLLSHYYFPNLSVANAVLIGGVAGSSLHNLIKAVLEKLLTDREIELFRKLILLVFARKTIDTTVLHIVKHILYLEYILGDKVKADSLAQQLTDMLKEKDFKFLLQSQLEGQERERLALEKYKLELVKEKLVLERANLDESRITATPRTSDSA